MTADDFSDSFYYRAFRTKIGEALRSHLLAKKPPPERVSDLLQKLDQPDGEGKPERPEEREPVPNFLPGDRPLAIPAGRGPHPAKRVHSV
jgi:hypothetical protein